MPEDTAPAAETTTTATATEVPATAPETPAVAAETPAAETPPNAVQKMFAPLLEAGKPKPSWYEGMRFDATNGEYDLGDLKDAPIEVQRLAFTVTEHLTKAGEQFQTQQAELAKREKALEQRELAAKRAMVSAKKLPVSDAVIAAMKKSMPKVGEEPPDLYTEEGIEWRARKAAADHMQVFIDAIKAAADDDDKAIAAEVEATAQAEQRAAWKTFVLANQADFDDPVIYGRIKTNMSQGMPIERAHQVAVLELSVENDHEQLAAAQERARRRIDPGSGKRPGAPETPDTLDGATIVQFYADHPDALKRDFEQYDHGR